MTRASSRGLVAAISLGQLLVGSFSAPANAAAALQTPSGTQTVADDSFTSIGAGLSVSGAPGDVRVSIQSSDTNGDLRIITTTNLTPVDGNDNSATITDLGSSIAFQGSQTDVNAGLQSLEYRAGTQEGATISVEVLDADTLAAAERDDGLKTVVLGRAS